MIKKLLKIIGADFSSLGISNLNSFIAAHYISVVIFSIFGLILNIFLTTIYSFEVLGYFNFYLTLNLVVSNIACMGFNFSVLAFLSRIENLKLKSSILNNSLIHTFLGAILSCSILYITRHLLNKIFNDLNLSHGMIYIIPSIFFFALNKIFFAAFNAIHSMYLLSITYALRGIGYLSFVLLIYKMNFKWTFIPVSMSITEGLIFLLYFIYYIKNFNPRELRYFKYISKINYLFIKNSTISSFILDINPKVDILFIGAFESSKVLGIYSFCSMIIEGISQFFIVLQNNINPILTKIIKNKEITKLDGIINSFKLKLTGASVIIAVVSILFCHFLLKDFLNIDFGNVGLITLSILFLGYSISVGYTPFNMLFNQGNKPKLYRNYLLSIAISNIIVNSALVPYLGYIGAALGTCTSHLIGVIILKKQVLDNYKIRI